MEFTLEELSDIYFMLLDYGGYSSRVILSKIEQKYTFCPICNRLFLKDDFQAHYDSEFVSDD
jgi:hypothetical protein